MSSAEPSARTEPISLWRWPGTEWEWLLAGVLAALLLLIGFAILRSGPGAHARAVQLHTQGVQTDARITRIETTGPGGPRVSIQFTAAGGQVVIADDQRPGGQYAIGKTLPVVYDPDDPQSFAFGSRADVDAPEPVWVFFGGLITGVGLWQLARTLAGLRLLRRVTTDAARM